MTFPRPPHPAAPHRRGGYRGLRDRGSVFARASRNSVIARSTSWLSDGLYSISRDIASSASMFSRESVKLMDFFGCSVLFPMPEDSTTRATIVHRPFKTTLDYTMIACIIVSVNLLLCGHARQGLNRNTEVRLSPYYEQDGIVIYHSDCREVLSSLAADSATLAIADIPYGKVNRDSGGLRGLDKGDADEATFDHCWLAGELMRLASGSIYFWCGSEQVSSLRAAMVEGGLTTRLCVWEKSDPSPMNGEHFWLSALEACVFGRKSKATFNEFCKSPRFYGPCERNINHPTPKPEWLMNRLINASSLPGDLVIDPCCGSGTTLVSAKVNGRRAIGIDVNESYCEIAAKRLAQGVLFGAA